MAVIQPIFKMFVETWWPEELLPTFSERWSSIQAIIWDNSMYRRKWVHVFGADLPGTINYFTESPIRRVNKLPRNTVISVLAVDRFTPIIT